MIVSYVGQQISACAVVSVNFGAAQQTYRRGCWIGHHSSAAQCYALPTCSGHFFCHTASTRGFSRFACEPVGVRWVVWSHGLVSGCGRVSGGCASFLLSCTQHGENNNFEMVTCNITQLDQWFHQSNLFIQLFRTLKHVFL